MNEVMSSSMRMKTPNIEADSEARNIETHFKSVDGQIARAGELIGTLGDRLTPVLTPSYPTPANDSPCADKIAPELCPMSRRMLEFEGRLRVLNEALTSLLSRLEI